MLTTPVYAIVALALICTESQGVDRELQTALSNLGADTGNTSYNAFQSLRTMLNNGSVSTDAQYATVVSKLVELFETDNDFRREDGADILRIIATKNAKACKPAVAALAKVVKGNDGGLRCAVITTLATIGPEATDSISALREVYKSGDEFEKTRAAAALVRISPDDKDALQSLIQWVRSGDPTLRSCAAISLGSCGSKAQSAAPSLRAALNDDNRAVRVLAAGALWDIDGATAEVLPILVRALTEDDETINSRPFDVSEWRPSHRMTAASILGRMGQKAESAIPNLDNALDDPDSVLRFSAAKALGNMGKAAEKPLQRALEDSEPEVRKAAAKALEKIRSQSK